MPLPPSGTYLVYKVDENDNFVQEVFTSEDISSLGGALYSDLTLVSGILQTDINTRATTAQLISTSGVLQSDINTRATTAQLVAASGVLQTDINTRATLAQLIATSGVLQTQITDITRNNYVLVKELNDFPTPVGNVISLSADTIYEINGNINVGNNRLAANNRVSLRGKSHLVDSITYTGTGNMITAQSGSMLIDELKIDTASSGSRAILFSGSSAAGHHLHLTNTHFGDTGVYEVALIQGGEGLFMSDCSFSDAVTKGITVTGALTHLTIENCRFESTQSGCVTLTVQSGTYEVFNIRGNHMNSYPSQTVFSIPNLTTIEAGHIKENIIIPFSGGGTALASGGLNNNNIYWYIEDNEGLDDFKYFSVLKFSDNVTATPVANSTTYYVASGTNHSSSSAQRFDITVNNRTKYIGRENLTLQVTAVGSVSSVANNNTLRVAIYKHDNLLATDTLITEAEVRSPVANQAVSFAMTDVVSMKTNDYLEIRVRNITDNQNIVLEFMQFKVFS